MHTRDPTAHGEGATLNAAATDSAVPNFCDGNLSRFGVGFQTATFSIGSDVRWHSTAHGALPCC